MPSLSASSSVFGRFTGRKQVSETTGDAFPNASTSTPPEESAVSSPPPLETVTEGVGAGAGIEKSKFQHNGHHRRTSSILSLTNSVADVGHNIRRSASLRSHRTQPSSGSGGFGHKPRFPSSGHPIASPLTTSPVEDEEDKDIQALPPTPATQRPRGKFAIASRSLSQKFKSSDTLPTLPRPLQDEPMPERPPTAIELSKTASMVTAPAVPKRAPPDKPALQPQASFTSTTSREAASSHTMNGIALQPAQSNTVFPPGGYSPQSIYQQIHETSSKRMATIDYMRKVHEGNIYYFSTLHYSPSALQSVPSMHPLKMGRRATNYLVLGNSLPALDLNSGTALEYLKALSALIQEFETYQNLSGVDSSGSSLGRGRMGQMFESGMSLGMGMGKGRRASTATDAIALPSNGDMLGLPKTMQDPHSPLEPLLASHGHEFAHLVTPHLPFEPDFTITFATLCDTLIDTYSRLLDLVSGPEQCSPAVGEAFAKADKAVRKILVANVLREFEDSTRAGVKGEVAGLGRLVLGGLM